MNIPDLLTQLEDMTDEELIELQSAIEEELEEREGDELDELPEDLEDEEEE